MAIGGMAVNISLVQQTLGNCIHGYWLRVGVIFDDNMPTKGEVEERAPGEATLFQESNGGSPLHNPDNELNFISVREIEEYTQAESLGQQLVGGLEAPAGVAPTLEAAAEAAEGSTAFEERSNEEDLYVIAMLSSDAAKFMIPQVEDWVDLCAVSSN